MQMQRGRPRKPSNLTFALGVSVVLHVLLFALISFAGTDAGSSASSGQRIVLTGLEFGRADDTAAAAANDNAKDVPPEDQQEPAAATTPVETGNEQTNETKADVAERTAPAEQTTEHNGSEQARLLSNAGSGSSEEVAGNENAPPVANAGRPPRVELPRLIGEISPDYPVQARRRGLEGVVVIRVTISTSGEPVDTTIVSPSEHSQLNEAAVSAVRAARFRPGTIDKDPSEMSLSIRIVFEVS